MTPATKRLIELLEEITIPLATRAQSWEIATRIRATIAEVRAEETVTPPIPPEMATSSYSVYGERGPFSICHGEIVDARMRSLALWQQRIVVNRANALYCVCNPAAVRELIASFRNKARAGDGTPNEWYFNAKWWVEQFDKEPGNET